MGTFRIHGQDFLSGVLQYHNPLATDRDNDEMLFLQFGQFLLCQTSGTDRTGARQRFEVTNHGIQKASQPRHAACAQQEV